MGPSKGWRYWWRYEKPLVILWALIYFLLFIAVVVSA